ncbi:MAG: hypothetical protein M5U19_05620 [Microthrixaceae bacterium]|nr:hypothetical protein [Microthrixaceae bacterium]
MAFGGAGPLHGCEVADELGVATVIVPAMAGVLSAVGLLTSPRGVELVRSWPTPLEHHGLAGRVEELTGEARRALGRPDATAEVFLDCRYQGQSHDLRVRSVEGFHEVHQQVNGYSRPSTPVELTAVRVSLTAPAPMEASKVFSAAAHDLGAEVVLGPEVVARDDCTIWIPEGWHGRRGALGALVLQRREVL